MISQVITNHHWTLEVQDAGDNKQVVKQTLSMTKAIAKPSFDQNDKETTKDIESNIYSIPIIVDLADKANMNPSSIAFEYQESDEDREIVEYHIAYGIQIGVGSQPPSIP